MAGSVRRNTKVEDQILKFGDSLAGTEEDIEEIKDYLFSSRPTSSIFPANTPLECDNPSITEEMKDYTIALNSAPQTDLTDEIDTVYQALTIKQSSAYKPEALSKQISRLTTFLTHLTPGKNNPTLENNNPALLLKTANESKENIKKQKIRLLFLAFCMENAITISSKENNNKIEESDVLKIDKLLDKINRFSKSLNSLEILNQLNSTLTMFKNLLTADRTDLNIIKLDIIKFEDHLVSLYTSQHPLQGIILELSGALAKIKELNQIGFDNVPVIAYLEMPEKKDKLTPIQIKQHETFIKIQNFQIPDGCQKQWGHFLIAMACSELFDSSGNFIHSESNNNFLEKYKINAEEINTPSVKSTLLMTYLNIAFPSHMSPQLPLRRDIALLLNNEINDDFIESINKNVSDIILQDKKNLEMTNLMEEALNFKRNFLREMGFVCYELAYGYYDSAIDKSIPANLYHSLTTSNSEQTLSLKLRQEVASQVCPMWKLVAQKDNSEWFEDMSLLTKRVAKLEERKYSTTSKLLIGLGITIAIACACTGVGLPGSFVGLVIAAFGVILGGLSATLGLFKGSQDSNPSNTADTLNELEKYKPKSPWVLKLPGAYSF